MSAESMRLESRRGRDAKSPTEIPAKGWKDIFWRLVSQVSEDRVMLTAAGVTFYLLLALFPALAAFVSLYGLVADPVIIADHVSALAGVLPSGGIDLLTTQLKALATQDSQALSLGFLLGLGIALWSANNGIKSLFDALNIVYGEREKRGFIRLTLLSFTFTGGALLVGIFLLATVAVIPAVLAFLSFGAVTEFAIGWGRWPLLLMAVALVISLIYRFGPSREKAKWRWLTWGSALATTVWLAASIGFSFYLENFADYNATYGSLGAVIGFMMWTWISVMILLMGAELNAEMEHQTAQDTTTGPPQPLGQRGAFMADDLGKTSD